MAGLTGRYSLSFQKKGQTKQKNASGEFSRDLNTKSQQKVLQPLLQITERSFFATKAQGWRVTTAGVIVYSFNSRNIDEVTQFD